MPAASPFAGDEADRHRKPLSIALGDIVDGRIDQQVLMAPDIQFDDIEQESAELFTDEGSLSESFSSESEDTEADDSESEDEGEDDLSDVDDLFDLGGDDDSESSE